MDQKEIDATILAACPNFFMGYGCGCKFCSEHEPCDECKGWRWPDEMHEEHCSLNGIKE